jgi:hypothetical protein
MLGFGEVSIPVALNGAVAQICNRIYISQNLFDIDTKPAFDRHLTSVDVNEFI